MGAQWRTARRASIRWANRCFGATRLSSLEIHATFEAMPLERFELTLRDGTPVIVRPLIPEDRDSLAEAYRRLSPEARYHRFWTHTGEVVGEKMLNQILAQDPEKHVTWTVLDPARDFPPIGGASWWRSMHPSASGSRRSPRTARPCCARCLSSAQAMSGINSIVSMPSLRKCSMHAGWASAATVPRSFSGICGWSLVKAFTATS